MVGVLWMVEVILVINIVSKMVVHGQLVVTSYNSVKTHYCLKYKQTSKQANKIRDETIDLNQRNDACWARGSTYAVVQDDGRQERATLSQCNDTQIRQTAP